MCNDYRLMVELASVIEKFENLKIKIRFPEGRPNVEAREDIKITDTAPIIRTVEGARGGRACPTPVELAEPEEEAGLQFPIRRTRVRPKPVPHRR